MNKRGLILKDKYTYEDILISYLDCRKRKRNKDQAMSYELGFEKNLEKLLNRINNGTYTIGPAKVFTISDPKKREIWAAFFGDRIVHHLLFNSIRDYYELRYITDSFSCITGRGTLRAALRAYEFARSCSQNYAIKNTYYGKIDVKNYFVSINKHLLWDIIKRAVGNYSLTSELIKQNIFYDPTINFIDRRDPNIEVPYEKSLFNIDHANFGLPIGNVTSQCYANVYLNELDQYCKHVLKIKYYIRYVDDILIFDNSPKQIHEWIKLINEFLNNKLGLKLHEKKIAVQSIYQGFDFVGSSIKPYRIEPSKRLIVHALKAANKIEEEGLTVYNLQSLQSFLGMMQYYNSFNFRQRLCNEGIIKELFLEHNEDYTKIWCDLTDDSINKFL